MSKYKQIESIKSNFKKRNYKAYIFFLVFTFLIWSFVQLSKTYEHDVQVDFQLKEIPEHIIIENKSQAITAQVQQTGFKILSINLFNSSVDLKFNELDSLTDYFVYDLNKNQSKISKSLNISDNELEFNQEQLRFVFYKLSSKRLKVKHNFKITFEKGYDSIHDFKFEPAYIEVFGDISNLKTLEYISTEEKSFSKVSDSLTGEVNIKTIDSIPNRYSQESIMYSLPVVKFTEGSFEIPIDFEKDDFNDKFVIFPKTVKVNFTTSLSNYERIDESGFKVIAKYRPDENFMILELVKQPKQVKHVSLENHKVDYLIKK